jgi:hypothetical protein
MEDAMGISREPRKYMMFRLDVSLGGLGIVFGLNV